MPTSALPAAIDALVSILDASSGLAGVDVVDGPPADDVATNDFLAVGWSGTEDQAAEIVQDFNAVGGRTRNEELTIACVIDVWSGDDGFATVRDRAFAILGAVETALRSTDLSPEAPTLNGTVLWAHLTTGDVSQQQSNDGALVGLNFSLTCRARI